MINISKDLLEKITGDRIKNIILTDNTSLNPDGTNIVFKTERKIKVLSKYELISLCKEYIYSSGFSVDSGIGTGMNGEKNYSVIIFDMFEHKFFCADSEIKAVIKAIQWVEDMKCSK